MTRVGTVLGGKYEILKKIGQGGMSVVYRATDTYTSDIVAVKILKNIDDIAIVRLSEKDVVRHKLVQDIVKAYEKATGLPVKYEICPRRPGDIDECYADPTKAYTILGWKAKYDIDKMCIDSANWQKKNPDGYGE